MAADPDPQQTAVEMLRAVASSGFGIINAIQAQSAAVDDLVSMAKRNTHISADEVQKTLDLLQLAKDELANAYELALEATIATWSVTEVPGGVRLPSDQDHLAFTGLDSIDPPHREQPPSLHPEAFPSAEAASASPPEVSSHHPQVTSHGDRTTPPFDAGESAEGPGAEPGEADPLPPS